MYEIITLNPQLQTLLEAHDKEENRVILAATPWVQGHGEVPHRIVIRNNLHEWVVHRQIIGGEPPRVFFEHGNYFNKKTYPFDDVWAKFVQRANNHLGLEV